MRLLRFEGVWKTYDEVRWVLDDVALDVEPGSFTLIMGRSGSGKTTLLNLAAGLEVPSRGTVWIDEKDVSKLTEEERTQLRLRRVGLVFQHYQLIPQLTVFENVRLPLRLAKRDDADARTKTLLTEFGLSEHADSFPTTLSGGEAQRTGIARALANEPALLLADEPTANLDEENSRAALELLKEAATKLGAAVLVASHDELVREYADRVYHMKAGKLEAVDDATTTDTPTPETPDPPTPPTSPGTIPAPRSSPSPEPPRTRSEEERWPAGPSD